MKLQEKFDQVFSIFIRVSRADHEGYVSCYTCELRLPWRESQCGHWIRRGHSAVRYDERNCRPQCQDCNEHRGGMEESFEEHLRDDLGDYEVDILVETGKQIQQYTDSDYVALIREYRDKVKLYGIFI